MEGDSPYEKSHLRAVRAFISYVPVSSLLFKYRNNFVDKQCILEALNILS